MSTDGRDNEVPMPAEFRPYMEVELHAKVSGYVDQMYVDIGDRVKAGQLLATLEVPELRDEHARALAAEKRAVADYKDAHLVYQRLLAVEKDHPNLVAQQAQAVVRVARQTVIARQTFLDQVAALATNKLRSELDVSFARSISRTPGFC